MKRYTNIFINFLRNNMIKEMEYRGNFLMLSLLEVVWVVLQVLIIQIMFQYTDTIFGWTKSEMFFLMGFFRVIKGIIDTFVRPNFLLFPTLITNGDLDLFLTKPVNTIYMISSRRQDFVEFSSAIAGVAIMIYALTTLNLVFNSTQIILFIVSSVCSFIVFYFIFLMITTLAFFITRMTALRPFYDLLSNVSKYPAQIFTQGKLFYEILLLPFFLISTIPVQIVLGKSPQYFILFELIGTVATIFLSLKFWKFAIKRYSSASS